MAAVEADAPVEALGALTLPHHIVETSPQAGGIRCPQVRAGHPWSRRIAYSRTSRTVASEAHRTFPPRFPVRTRIQASRDRASEITRSLRIISAGRRTIHSRVAVLSPAVRRALVTGSLALMGSAANRLADFAEALAVAGGSGADSDALIAALASAASASATLVLAALASDPSSISIGAGRDSTDMTRSGMARTRASVIRIIQALDIRTTQSLIAIPIIQVQIRIRLTATLSPPTTIWA